MIGKAWKEGSFDGSIHTLRKGLNRCAARLKSWSNKKFGELPRRIERLKAELEEMYGKDLTRDILWIR